MDTIRHMDVIWSGIGTAVIAALVSVGISLGIRWFDREEPDWLIERIGMDPSWHLYDHFKKQHDGAEPELLVQFTNVGEGNAFRLTVAGKNCATELFVRDPEDSRGFRIPRAMARIKPEDTFGVLIWFDQGKVLPDCSVTLSWNRAPVRRLRRGERVILLSDPEPERIPWTQRAGRWVRARASRFATPLRIRRRDTP